MARAARFNRKRAREETLEAIEVLMARNLFELSRVAGPTKLTVDTTSKTLATLGLVLHADARLLRIITPSVGVFWDYGTATVDSAPLFAGTNEEAGSRGILQTLEFLVAADTIDVWVEELG